MKSIRLRAEADRVAELRRHTQQIVPPLSWDLPPPLFPPALPETLTLTQTQILPPPTLPAGFCDTFTSNPNPIPNITEPQSYCIYYPSPLSPTELCCTSPIEGSFVYTPPEGRKS